MAYRVEISMVAIMVARSNVAYQRALCGLRGLCAASLRAAAAGKYNPSPLSPALRARIYPRVNLTAPFSPTP